MKQSIKSIAVLAEVQNEGEEFTRQVQCYLRPADLMGDAAQYIKERAIPSKYSKEDQLAAKDLRQSALHPLIVDNIERSERDGGVFLKDMKVGDRVEFDTASGSQYKVVKTAADGYTIEGNKHYCPIPTATIINGSTWGGSMLKVGFIGEGMHLEFSTDDTRILGQVITTTRIMNVKWFKS